MTEKISYIYPEDLANLQKDENGNYLVPEGFEIYKIEDPKTRLLKLINELELQLSQTETPSDAELIELGKIFHPYYELQIRINQYRKEL